MSQAKVDKYKNEKKNREKNIKKSRTKKIVGVLVASLCVGALIGIPLGRKMYDVSVDVRKSKATVSAEAVDLWMQENWIQKYSSLWPDNVASDSDAFSEDAVDIEDIGSDDSVELNLE